MSKTVRVSLANKCQLLFGIAVVLILAAALTVVWQRMQKLVNVGLEVTARKLADAYLANMIQVAPVQPFMDDSDTSDWARQGIVVQVIMNDEFDTVSTLDPFLAEAIERFETHSDRLELHRPARDEHKQRYHRFARAIRKSDRQRLYLWEPDVSATDIADPLVGVLLIQVRADPIEHQQMLNRIYIVVAGLLAGLLAIGVFWFITTRIILSPVRVLRDTAEKVTEGDLNIRADINTGDEFEQLSDAFNHMLERIAVHQEDLRRMNKGLDLKLGELAEHNMALYEADKIKGEFLANVSHELRTPLNSIIGFAEVLQETLQHRTGPVDEKRKRYIANIIRSSRQLLELINDLLDLAKIEAGRMELRVSGVSIVDTAEGLVNLIRPHTQKKQITVNLSLDSQIPIIQTDESKVHQILFNFLSNAAKFTPAGGTIELAARLLSNGQQDAHVCLSVSDTGPGIAAENQDRIFDKFTQLESTETRQHSGTGLGLTISRDLARLLRGRIELDSTTGRGATFSLIIPLVLEPHSAPLMPQIAQNQGAADEGSKRRHASSPSSPRRGPAQRHDEEKGPKAG